MSRRMLRLTLMVEDSHGFRADIRQGSLYKKTLQQSVDSYTTCTIFLKFY